MFLKIILCFPDLLVILWLKATAVVATLFIVCSLALTIISRADLTPTESVLDIIEEKSDDTPSIPENN